MLEACLCVYVFFYIVLCYTYYLIKKGTVLYILPLTAMCCRPDSFILDTDLSLLLIFLAECCLPLFFC